MKTKITSNILENISRKLQGEDIQNYESKKIVKENILVLFGGANKGIEEKVNQIKTLKEKGANISIGFSFVAERILDTNKIINILKPDRVYKEEDLFILQTICRENMILISPNITINTLSKVSLGMIDSFVTNVIWTFLYEGKKVYLDFNSVRNYLGIETNNKAIINLMESHINTIKNMGAIEVNKGDYSNLFQKGEGLNFSKAQEKIDKKVITENDILSISSNTNLLLEKGTIITPLAKDKAKEKNIIIEIK